LELVIHGGRAQYLAINGTDSFIDDVRLVVPDNRVWIVLGADFVYASGLVASTHFLFDVGLDVDPILGPTVVTLDTSARTRGPLASSERWCIGRELVIPPLSKIQPSAPSLFGGASFVFRMLYMVEET